MAATQTLNDLILIGKPLTTTGNFKIPYLMLHEQGQGWKERMDPSNVQWSYIAICEWADANDFTLDMLGWHVQVGNGRISRHNPEPHPFDANLYCQGLDLVRGDGRVAMDAMVEGGLSYDFAVYNCTFLPVNYVMGSDAEVQSSALGEASRYVVHDRKSTGESIQASGQFFFGGQVYVDGVLQAAPILEPYNNNALVPTPPTIQTTVGQIEMTWMYVPDPISNCLDTADSFYGTVNDAMFDIYPMDTLLFLGAEPYRIPLSPGGNQLWNIKFKFAYRRQTWQCAYRPNVASPPGDWSYVYDFYTSTLPYQRNTFPNLFKL